MTEIDMKKGIDNTIRELQKRNEEELKKLKENPIYDVQNMRIPSENKLFLHNKLKEFAEIICAEDGYKRVVFGKMDIRGAYSITPIYNQGTTGHQKHFLTRGE